MNKWTHFASVAFAGIGLATSALADDSGQGAGKFSGVLETAQGSTFVSNAFGDVDPSASDYYASRYAVRLGMELSDAVLLQADADIDYGSLASDSFNSNDNLQDAMQLGVHLAHSDAQLLKGMFGGMGRSQSDLDIKSDFWFAGGEVRVHSAPFAPYFQIGYLDGERTSSAGPVNQFRDAIFVRGVGRHVLNDSALIQLEAAYANGVADTDEDRTQILEWGARIELKVIENLPIFLAYRGTSFENADSSADSGQDRFVEQSVYAGLVYRFGSNQHASNANLDLPAFGRWVASGEVLD